MDEVNQPTPPTQIPQASDQMHSSSEESHNSKIILIIIGIVLLILVGAGSYVLGTKKSQPVVENIVQTTPIPSPIPTIDATADWKTYRSALGGFTIKYPNDWIVQGFEGEKPGFNENSNKIHLYSKTPYIDLSNGDYMCVNIEINSTDNYLLKDGTIIAALDNGLNLYQRKLISGGKEFPILQLTKDGYSIVNLPNSKILTHASFNCVGGNSENIKLIYSQQLESAEYMQAIEILKSISY